MTWVELCPHCEGDGCTACEQEGYVPHGHQPDDPAAIQAADDQLKADLNRDAEILGHLNSRLKQHGITEAGIRQQLLDTYYLHWLSE